MIIGPGISKDEVNHAHDLDPLASVGPSGASRLRGRPDPRGFSARFSLNRLPNDPKLRQRAAEFLRKQGKEDLAREVEVRGNKTNENDSDEILT
jgi:hypothetical protein